MDMGAVLGAAGTIMGIVGVIFGLLTTAKNNAKWGAIVEHKVDTMIDRLTKVENRLDKYEDDRSGMRNDIIAHGSRLDAMERTVTRLHDRVDRLCGGRDAE